MIIDRKKRKTCACTNNYGSFVVIGKDPIKRQIACVCLEKHQKSSDQEQDIHDHEGRRYPLKADVGQYERITSKVDSQEGSEQICRC